jgi:hypothetical protein
MARLSAPSSPPPLPAAQRPTEIPGRESRRTSVLGAHAKDAPPPYKYRPWPSASPPIRSRPNPSAATPSALEQIPYAAGIPPLRRTGAPSEERTGSASTSGASPGPLHSTPASATTHPRTPPHHRRRSKSPGLYAANPTTSTPR